MGSFFGIFQLFVAAYLIYGAATGKGQLFKMENIKKGMEEKYKKTMRTLSWILAPLMLGLGVMDILQENAIKSQQPVNGTIMIISWVCWGLIMVGVVAMAVASSKMSNKTKQSAAPGGKPAGAPRAAFEFDEEESKPLSNKPSHKN